MDWYAEAGRLGAAVRHALEADDPTGPRILSRAAAQLARSPHAAITWSLEPVKHPVLVPSTVGLVGQSRCCVGQICEQEADESFLVDRDPGRAHAGR